MTSGGVSSMEVSDDVVVEIISYLPLKLAVQCKLLSKNFNRRIILPELLIYCKHACVHKISINPLVSTTHSASEISMSSVSLSASCKGLLLLKFFAVTTYCVFNPITGEHQLISYPKPEAEFKTIGFAGLAVDYPNSDLYKLVTIGELVEEEEELGEEEEEEEELGEEEEEEEEEEAGGGGGRRRRGYKFHVYSSDGSGSSRWRAYEFRMDFIDLAIDSRPVYANDSLHWLRSDGSILVFDTKRAEAKILDAPPEFNNHNEAFCSSIKPRFDTWMGMSRGLLTLIRMFKKSIAIATYDYGSSNWRVSNASASFIKDMTRYPVNYGFPIWIDSKQAFFFVDCRRRQHAYLYEYDSNINRYTIARVLGKDHPFIYPMCSFKPSRAIVHKTPKDTTPSEEYGELQRQSVIAEALDELKRLITEAVSVPFF